MIKIRKQTKPNQIMENETLVTLFNNEIVYIGDDYYKKFNYSTCGKFTI